MPVYRVKFRRIIVETACEEVDQPNEELALLAALKHVTGIGSYMNWSRVETLAEDPAHIEQVSDEDAEMHREANFVGPVPEPVVEPDYKKNEISESGDQW